MNVLVIGVGNEFRGDDAAGLLVARRLSERELSGIDVIEQSGEGTDLMEAWEGVATVFVIDAARSGAEPGTIHRFESHKTRLPVNFFSFSSHAFGVAEAIEMSGMLDESPNQVVVYGIEGTCFDPGIGLSPAVEKAVEIVVNQLLEEIKHVSHSA